MAVSPRLRPVPLGGARRVWDLATIPLYGSFVVLLVAFFAGARMSPDVHHDVINIGFAVFNLVAFGLAVRAATHPRLDRRTRLAWRFIAASYALLVVSGYLFAVVGITDPFPTPGDLFRLAFAPVLFAGLLCFPMRSHSATDRYKLALDIGTVVAGTFMLMWYLVLGPAVAAEDSSMIVMFAAVAYPAGDLVLVFGATTVLLRGTASSIRRPIAILVTALAFEIAGDLYYMSEIQVSEDWPFLCWLTGHFLMAAAAFEQCRLASGHRLRPTVPTIVRRLTPVSLLPYLAIVLGYALLLTHAVQEGLYPWGGLVTGAVVVTALVVARQVVVLRENHALVVTDSLTGLANRVRLRESLTRALNRSQRSGRVTGVLLVDLDGFKQINDTMGHEAGDAMLVAFGHLLVRAAPNADTVGRLGGDEFAVVLDDIGGCADAVVVARQLLAAAATPVPVLDRELTPRPSIGIAVSSPECRTASDLLHRADMAMYRAKRRRAHSWQVYDAETGSADVCGALEDDLRKAVGTGQLRLRYQPIVALDTGELVGLEALVRWEHPTRGQIVPGLFIPLAEEASLIMQLGQWVLDNACAQARSWQRLLPPGHRPLQLSVNLSPRQLEQESLVDDISAVLRRTGFAAGDLILEVTESALVNDRLAVPALRALSGQGIRIALDDFGTGYSSLQYLTRLPVDILKLDRCFVGELNHTPEGSAVAQAVIRLSQVLGLETVAEGIENADQAAQLSDLGYRTGQGYHFSRPLAPEAAQALITGAPLPRPAAPSVAP